MAFSTTCAVHIEDCEGWWLSGCHGSVAEHWRLKPEVSWVRFPVAASLFIALCFKLFLFSAKTVCSKHSHIFTPQAYLPKARELQSSLTCTRSRLHVLKPVFSGLDQQKEHLTNGDVNVTQLRQPMIHNRVSSPVQNGVVSTQNGVSMNQNGVSGSENKVYVEMVITSGGPELASINYEQLEQSCETSIQLAVW